MDKRHTNILVTDSGLGGLSVFAGLARDLAQSSDYDSICLTYFNAWPKQLKGYNHFPDMEARANVFNNAMTAMAKFNPDTILIACNTLSVIYPLTQFSQDTDIPVTGIVDHGVGMMAEQLAQDPDSRVVIFATPTTIEGNSHKKALIDQGFHPDRIITQGCLNLAGKIERDPFGQEVVQMIDTNTKEAAQKAGTSRGKLFAALCCTHFGYCRDQFQTALAKQADTEVVILNPNDRMVEQACANTDKNQDKSINPTKGPEINLQIFSRVTWEDSRIQAYDRLTTPVSSAVVTALKHYTLDRNLFSIDID